MRPGVAAVRDGVGWGNWYHEGLRLWQIPLTPGRRLIETRAGEGGQFEGLSPSTARSRTRAFISEASMLLKIS